MKRKSKVSGLVAMLAGLSLVCGCGNQEEPAHTHDHQHQHGPNGGALVDLDGVNTKLEFLHHDKEGRIEVQFLTSDGKTPANVEGPITFNLKTKTGPLQVIAKKVSDKQGRFGAENTLFKGTHLSGQIAFSLAGKEYYLPFPEDCAHGKESDKHEHGDDCEHGKEDHKHEHGDDCDHQDGHDHAGEHSHGPGLTETQWTATHEWFIEASHLELGKAAHFAIHLTRLNDFQPVKAGYLEIFARCGDKEIQAKVMKPKSPGIFAPGITLTKEGDWNLELRVTNDQGESDQIIWKVHICSHAHQPPAAQEETPGITLLKEKQWKAPFATMAVNTDFTLPANAVISDQGKSSIFIQVSGELFRKQIVQTTPVKPGKVKITSGLNQEDRVVIKGMKLLQ